MIKNRKKILIVDENSTYITNLRKSLNEAGYEVVYWDDSGKAMEIVKNLQPDLIITEIDSPHIRGQEFYEKIKMIPEVTNTPFVFLSNQKRVDDRINSMEMGIDDFITKPFYIEEVVARIENLISEVSGQAEAAYQNERGFSGDIAELNLIDLIQTLEVGKKSGIIKLKYKSYQGYIYMQNGEVVDATFENLSSKDALMRMMVWTEGKFYVEMTDVGRSSSIQQENKILISEGLRHLDRWSQIKNNLPSLNSLVSRAPEMTLSQNNLTADEKYLLNIVNLNDTIYDLVVKSAFDDIKTLETINFLFKKGYLLNTDHQNYETTTLKSDTAKHTTDPKRIPFIVVNLLRRPEEQKRTETDRRKNQRRNDNNRRRLERRREYRMLDGKVYLEKSELLQIREKLL